MNLENLFFSLFVFPTAFFPTSHIHFEGFNFLDLLTHINEESRTNKMNRVSFTLFHVAPNFSFIESAFCFLIAQFINQQLARC